MRSTRAATDHQEAVARRLALLGAELDAVRASLDEGSPMASGPVASDPDPVHPEPGPSWADRAGPAETVVPLPGRHAERSRTEAVRELLGIQPARFSLGPAQLGVVAVLVVLAVAFSAWSSLRARPEPVPGDAAAASAAPLATPEPAATSPPGDPVGSAGTTGSAGAAAQAEQVVVDVAGKVRRPGIAVLDPGSRVVDAIRAAGGARRGADLSSVNLARPLVDGEQIIVGQPVPAGVAAAAVPGGTATAPGALVNVNLADQAELETLPGIGPVTAQAILAWREQHGGFTAVEELLEVDGIGDATLEQAPLVTV